MSYILDALKRADADRERQRAAVPDLHAQSDAYPVREPDEHAGPRGWQIGLALCSVAVLGVGGWLYWPGRATLPSPPPLPAIAAPPAIALPTPAPPSPSPSPSQAQVRAPAPAVAATPRSNPAPRAATPPSVAVAKRPSPPTSVAESLPLYAALPPTLRSELPALAVNGSVYSRTRTARMVILNGQVFREGDRPVDGLTVEEIRPRSSVLSFRGTRFELPH